MITGLLLLFEKPTRNLRYICIFLLVTLLGAWNPTSIAGTVSAASDPVDMAMPRAVPLRFAASAKHTATVIFLHGLGDTGFGWASAVEGWIRRDKLNEVKFVLPHAPRMPITAAEGMQLPGWFDIAALTGKVEDIRNNQDERGLMETRDYISSLVQAEIDAGIPANRIVLGGFSQGGAMALLSGLTSKVKLGGVIALSAWLPLDSKFAALAQESNVNQDTPVFMAHGSVDTVVPTPFGKMSYEALKKLNYPVTMKLYNGMGHSACQEELDDVETFLLTRLPQGEGKSEL
ncbi:acyl-protein thioesterase-1-like protein [Poronia punctata]|nr:acyl-protein thioesterase-1-like protein [Poronia punctata]